MAFVRLVGTNLFITKTMWNFCSAAGASCIPSPSCMVWWWTLSDEKTGVWGRWCPPNGNFGPAESNLVGPPKHLAAPGISCNSSFCSITRQITAVWWHKTSMEHTFEYQVALPTSIYCTRFFWGSNSQVSSFMSMLLHLHHCKIHRIGFVLEIAVPLKVEPWRFCGHATVWVCHPGDWCARLHTDCCRLRGFAAWATRSGTSAVGATEWTTGRISSSRTPGRQRGVASPFAWRYLDSQPKFFPNEMTISMLRDHAVMHRVIFWV